MGEVKRVLIDYEKVKQLAKDKKMAISKLSEELGMSATYLSDINRKGTHLIPLTHVKLMSLILDVSVDDILYKDPKAENKLADMIIDPNLFADIALRLDRIEERLDRIEEVMINVANALRELGSAEELAKRIYENKKPQSLIDAENMLERMFNSTGKRECEYGAFIYNCKTKYDNPPIELLHKAIFNKGCVIETIGKGANVKRVIVEGKPK